MPTTSCVIFDCRDPARPVPMASFALDAQGDGHLGYGLRYLERPDAFALDPIHLPLQAAQLILRRRQDGTYGVLSDAGPNAWGMAVAASIARTKNLPMPANAVEWFLSSWHYGSGCLGFSEHHSVPPDPGVRPAPRPELSGRLIQAIEALATNPDARLDEEAIRLVLPGGSLGGLRPKTLVLHEGIEHIVKLSRPDDRFNVPRAEYATLRLAHEAGIRVPDFELDEVAGRAALFIARFDRTNDGGRRHYISAHSLIGMEPPITPQHYQTRYSYAGIAESLRPLDDRARDDGHELFRRMVFNIMIGNVDDHMRNHAILMTKPNRFELAPAFDLVPHLEASASPQSIGVGASGAASTLENALSQCGRFLLTPGEARSVVGEVRAVVSGWRGEFRAAGLSETEIRVLSSCFSAAEQAERLSIVAPALTASENRRRKRGGGL